MTASIYDVAKRAGVSISTVSRILNQSASVNEKKAKAVREAMAYYHYEPNQFARGLVKQTSGMIGVYFPYAGGSVLDSTYHLELIKGMERVLEANHYSIVLLSESIKKEEGVEERPKFQEYMAQKKIDGLLLCGLSEQPAAAAIYREMLEREYPMVYIGKRLHKSGCHVYAQLETTMLQMIGKLYESGHRKVLFYDQGIQADYVKRVKEQAARQYPDLLLETIQYTDYGNLLRLQLVLSVRKYVGEQSYTAICSPCMEFLHTLVSVCRELKLSIPEDVSILTLEHSTGAGDLIYPPISAYHVPAKRMGEGAAQMLLEVLSGTGISGGGSMERVKAYESSYIKRESVRRV